MLTETLFWVAMGMSFSTVCAFVAGHIVDLIITSKPENESKADVFEEVFAEVLVRLLQITKWGWLAWFVSSVVLTVMK